MVFLGSTGKFDQVTLVRLDPQRPTEDLSNQVEQNIFTGDLEASNVFTSNIGIANLYPQHNFALGSNLWMNDQGSTTLYVKRRTELEQAFVSTQLGVNTNSAVFPFQVNETNRVYVDNQGAHLLVAEGNILCSNLIISQGISAEGDLTLTGNITATKITIDQGLEFGANLVIDDVGDPVFQVTGNVDTNGDLTVYGNLYVEGNVYITDTSIYGRQENLSVTNAILEVGSGNDSGTFDTAVLFHQDPSNVFIGYFPGAGGDELKVGRTISGPADDNITVLTDSNVDVHVYGNLYASHCLGAGNIAPVHNLDVGANLWAHDTASNVLYVRGNVYAERMTFGKGFNLGANVVVDDTAANVFQVAGRAAFTTLFATDRVGIANTNPVHTLCIGSNIHMHEVGANLAMFHGNVVSTRFMANDRVGIRQYNPDEALHVGGDIRIGGKAGVDANQDNTIKSSGGIVVHADDFGSDNTNNSLTLKAGAVAANVSVIELSSGATDATKQFIKLRTKNTERLVMNDRGMIGIANTNPSANLTVGGTVHVVGSNALTLGNPWGGNTTLRSYVDPALGHTYLQSRVLSGKGLNIHVSSTTAVGNPKMTILETGQVGIGTSTPQPLGLQVTGNVFVNSQVVARNNFYHETCPMTITNPILANNPDVMEPVLQLCRDSTSGTTQGARATFSLGKRTIVNDTSRTRLDVNLAHNDYAATSTIMTFLSEGFVGIGTHTPVAKLEVRASGSENPRTNGILVHNANDADNEDAIVCMEVNDAGGDAFSSYKITTGPTTGWSVGGAFSDSSKFKIAKDATSLNNSTYFVIDSIGNVGINSNAPSEKLDVYGDVKIGNKLTFRGVTAGSDTTDTTFLQEKAYGTNGRTELVLFKTDNSEGSQGPDQIRHIAARHVFNTYSAAGAVTNGNIDNILADSADVAAIDYFVRPVLSIEKERRVLINSVEDDLASDTRLYVEGNIKVKEGYFIDTSNLHIVSDGTSGDNFLKSLLQSDLSFQFGETGDFERMRIQNDGKVLINSGETAVTATHTLHVHDDTESDVTLANFQSPPGASSSKSTSVQVTTNAGYGGFLRAQKGTSSNTFVVGYLDNDTQVDALSIIKNGNVGIGTSQPTANLHIYNSNLLVEHATSNAIVNFKTATAVSNIYVNRADDDLYLYPAGGNVVVQGSLTVNNNIIFGGRIEFGDAVGIGVVTPLAPLHVSGGTIFNSSNVAKKQYSSTFSVLDSEGKNIILTFDKGAFYAKITAMLRYAADGRYLSTMVLEVQGGHSDNTQTSSIPIAVGTKNIFSGTNPYPWSQTVTTTATTLTVVPNTLTPRGGLAVLAYYYDFYIELMTASGGKLLNIKANTATKSTYTY
jgi:hypothetical protein